MVPPKIFFFYSVEIYGAKSFSRGQFFFFFVTLFHFLWASLVTQLVKNSPAMQETWVRSLGWEDPLEKERPPSPLFWPGEFHGLYGPLGRKESDTTE